LVVLSAMRHRDDAIYAEFLGHFTARLGGTPLFVALVAAGGFYLYAWVRRVPLALEGVTAVLAALAFVRPEALTVHDLTPPRPVFLIAAVVLQVWVALWRRDGWRLAMGGAVAAGWTGVLAWREYPRLREVVPGLDYLVAGLLLLPLAVLISLGKGGVLARWASRFRRGRPARTA
jgi:hypothetical protein